MGLPRIAPYPMPVVDSLPTPRVAWTIEPSRAALLVHDMQVHWLGRFDQGAEPIPTLLANIAALVGGCRAAGVPVVYTMQPAGQSPAQRGLLGPVWGDGIPAGSGGDAVAPQVAPAPGDEVIVKRRYSALVGTDLLARLRALGRDQLVVCGVYAHIGVALTAAHAFTEDVCSVIVADAVADFSEREHLRALEWAGGCCAGVCATDAVLGAMGARAATPASGVDLERMRSDALAALDDPPATLRDDDDLLDLGLDSIRLMALVGRWREAGLALAVEDLIEAEPTLAGWWAAAQHAGARASGR